MELSVLERIGYAFLAIKLFVWNGLSSDETSRYLKLKHEIKELIQKHSNTTDPEVFELIGRAVICLDCKLKK